MENMQKKLAEMAVLSLSVKKEINYISPGSGTESGKKRKREIELTTSDRMSTISSCFNYSYPICSILKIINSKGTTLFSS